MESFAQNAGNHFHFGIAGGLNTFPLIYGGPYGINVGGFAVKNRWMFRLGINGNVYGTDHFHSSPPPKARYYGRGLELGTERSFLSDSSKWILDAGLMLYDGYWTEELYLINDNSKISTNNYGAGPIVSLGYRLKSGWSIHAETSVSIGEYTKKENGILIERSSPEFRTWKLFGLLFRYRFGNADK